MSKRNQIIIQTLIIAAIVILINFIADNFYGYIDLTEDKRFTLEDETEDLLEDVEDYIFVEVLLEGNLSSEIKKLQDRTKEILRQFKSVNSNIDFEFTDLSEGTVKEVNMRRENLRANGILPKTLFIMENDQRVEKLVYPYAILNYGQRKIPIDLLEALKRGETEEEAINRSSILLEYKFASAVRKTDF